MGVYSLSDVVRRNHGTWRGWIRHVLGLAELQLGSLSGFQVADPAHARKLVFVCLGNINRSAYACAVARSLGQPSTSVGLSTTAGAPATPQAIAQARMRGVDLQGHRATPLAEYCAEAGDLYVVMEVRHARRLVAHGVPAASITLLGLWGHPMRVHLHDPHTLSQDYFATCFALIDSAVRALVHRRMEFAG